MSAVALAPPRTRGQPLVLIVLLLTAWALLRLVYSQPVPPSPALHWPTFAWPSFTGPSLAAEPTRAPSALWVEAPQVTAAKPKVPVPLPAGPIVRIRMPAAVMVGQSHAVDDVAQPEFPTWFSGMPGSGLSDSFPALSPTAFASRGRSVLAGVPVPRAAPQLQSRFSGDAWVLLRPDGDVATYPALPAYGRSQAGAVLRYRLSPSSPHRPEAYLRATSALGGLSEQDLAAGLSARPVGDLPLRLAAELRVSETAAGREVRPATMAVTELPPLYLPLDLRAEGYAQAGYVGGRYATAFVDGQARIDRTFLRMGDLRFSAGGGLWGGMQRGSSRLDAGPTAGLDFRLGRVRGRVAADYRFRVAGQSAPGSGPALTLSAGF